jgi:hypothetical protein
MPNGFPTFRHGRLQSGPMGSASRHWHSRQVLLLREEPLSLQNSL